MASEEKVDNQPYDEAESISDTESVDDPSVSHGSPGMESHGASPQREGGGDEAEETVQNQPYDEAVELSDDGSVSQENEGSPEQQQFQQSGGGYGMTAGGNGSQGRGSELGADSPPHGPDDSDSDDSTSDSNSEDGGGTGMNDAGGEAVFQPVEGGYDPKDFEKLDVTDEIKDLFQYITRYRPHNIELEERVKPFIPDYIPSVGDIDAFIKVPRPDGKQENLGLTVLDEPVHKQSDPTVIDMQLRNQSKQLGLGAAVVASIENAEKNPKEIRNWVESVSELHSSKPPTEVVFSKPMPDIESLMQVWPPQFEDMLANTPLPSPNLDIPLDEYARIVCAIFDIPVYNNSVESLHVLFTLFSEFKHNQHFQQDIMNANNTGGMGMGFGGDGMNMMS